MPLHPELMIRGFCDETKEEFDYSLTDEPVHFGLNSSSIKWLDDQMTIKMRAGTHST